MPIVALLVAVAAVVAFGIEFHRNKGLIPAGLMLFAIAFILNSWTIWNVVHWVW